MYCVVCNCSSGFQTHIHISTIILKGYIYFLVILVPAMIICVWYESKISDHICFRKGSCYLLLTGKRKQQQYVYFILCRQPFNRLFFFKTWDTLFMTHDSRIAPCIFVFAFITKQCLMLKFIIMFLLSKFILLFVLYSGNVFCISR